MEYHQDYEENESQKYCGGMEVAMLLLGSFLFHCSEIKKKTIQDQWWRPDHFGLVRSSVLDHLNIKLLIKKLPYLIKSQSTVQYIIVKACRQLHCGLTSHPWLDNTVTQGWHQKISVGGGGGMTRYRQWNVVFACAKYTRHEKSTIYKA